MPPPHSLAGRQPAGHRTGDAAADAVDAADPGVDGVDGDEGDARGVLSPAGATLDRGPTMTGKIFFWGDVGAGADDVTGPTKMGAILFLGFATGCIRVFVLAPEAGMRGRRTSEWTGRGRVCYRRVTEKNSWGRGEEEEGARRAYSPPPPPMPGGADGGVGMPNCCIAGSSLSRLLAKELISSGDT